MEELINKWQQRQFTYEKFAEKYRSINQHNYKKYTYKAVATRDCWKELLELSKLHQHDVSNRRELLIAYELKLWINPTQEQIEMAEQIVDMYLRN